MIDFFDENCTEETTASLFGLCDEESGRPAYIDTENQDTWIAEVINKEQKKVEFVAVDNCIEVLEENGDMAKRCDGLLVYEQNLVFVELKRIRKNWVKDGIEQLKTTIAHFKANGDNGADFSRKRAFLANSKHPQFKYSHKQEMQSFFNETGFRLIIVNKINV
ncbi:MAG: hypothetical protein NXI25_02875 [bacterium]|nr:hypothetical protein [bacterium]